MFERIQRTLYDFFKRKPDLVIYREPDTVYLERWHVIPRNPIFNIYLHHFHMSDIKEYLHTHPWLFNISILLSGSYIEYMPENMEEWKKGSRKTIQKIRRACWWWPVLRFGKAVHRIELFNDIDDKPLKVWTLFITGPLIQSWGFYCAWGLRDHKEFLQQTDEHISITGKGCD